MIICPQHAATALHMVQLMPLPPHQNPDWFNLSGAGLPRLFLKKEAVKWVSILTAS